MQQNTKMEVQQVLMKAEQKDEEQIKLQSNNNKIQSQENDNAIIEDTSEAKIETEEINFNANQVRMGDEILFTIPQELLKEQSNLLYRQRKTRWGERKIKHAKIQEDAVFNPLQALQSGNVLLPITQYGQAQLQIKMALYSDGSHRKSKWHHEIEKTFLPPMLNYISPDINLDEVQYLLRLYRLDQLTSKLNDYSPDDADIRSPSPQPIYDKDGRRINTRQVRKRDALHRQRISLIQDCMKMRKTFIPPQDYKPLKKFKKIYLTETAINDKQANYVGKIIGPNGTTQKLIERRSGCKVAVRGRGANKAQKDIFENYQPLHIIVVGDNDDQLDKGVREVEKLLNNQEDDELKDLIMTIGRQGMGFFDHSKDQPTWKTTFQMKNNINVKCSICNERSHPTSDCPQKQAYLKKQQTSQINLLLESQYSQFKQDLTSKNRKIQGTSFITDYEKKDIKALVPNQTSTKNINQIQNNSNNSNNSNNIAKVQNNNQNNNQNVVNELPQFEDD